MQHSMRHIYSCTPPAYLQMLNGLFRQQRLRLPLHTALERRPDKVVEEKRSVHKQRETEHLEPLECLPTKSE